jgi:glycosyltransferase involved in cell wall biosynthesis
VTLVSDRLPTLSVIVPVRDGEHFLASSLPALRASDLPTSDWELIVVDDSSLDGSAELASQYADRLVRLTGGPRGAAFARNRGVDVARGEILVFIDSDICVHRDTLRRISETLTRESSVSAVFGAYDLNPTADGLVSEYRNLFHRYVHERDAGDAVTFWAGCGAMRRTVFVLCGGFDENRGAEALEDIELGYRLAALGHRMVLRPEIQGQHLKRWTLRSMIFTDVRDRGIPWMRLLLRYKAIGATLNIKTSEQFCTLLAVIAYLATGAWLWSREMTWLNAALIAVFAILVMNAPVFTWFARQRDWWFAVRLVPLRLLYYGLNVVSVCLAMVPLGFRRRHPLPRTHKLVVSSRSLPH